MSQRAGAEWYAEGIPSRRRQLVGGLLVVRAVTGRWVRAEDVSEETGVHLRGVYRTLAALTHLGLALERAQEGRVVYWRVPRREVERWWRAR